MTPSRIMLPPPHRQRFLDFVCDIAPAHEFEAWVYGAHDLESFLNPSEYLEVLGANYKTTDGVRLAQEVAERVLTTREPDIVSRYRVELLVASSLQGSPSLLRTLRLLTSQPYSSTDIVPGYVIALASDMDIVPEESQYHLIHPDALAKRLAIFERYRESIVTEFEVFLRELREQRGAA